MFIFSKAIVYANLIPLISLIFLLIMVSYNPTHSKYQTRLFQIVAFLNIFMIFILIFDYIFSGLDTNKFVLHRKITSFFNFSFSPFIPLFLYKIFRTTSSNKLFYIPALLNLSLCFISIFNGMIFSITNENIYVRGPFFIVPFFTTLFYLATIIFQREYRYRHNKQIERLFLFAVVTFLIICLVLEVVYTYNFLSWDMSAICLLAYYLLLCIHNAILDPLTGAFNRLHYNKTLSNFEHRKPFTIAMVDLDNFKMVNDTYGHDAGDKVLIDFVTLLEKKLGSIAIIYRIGGDEFIALSRKASLSQLESILLQIRTEAHQDNVGFSYGLSEYTLHDEMTEVINTADQRMYEQKNSKKQNK